MLKVSLPSWWGKLWEIQQNLLHIHFFHTTNNSLKSCTENYLIKILLIQRTVLSIFDHLETRNVRRLLWPPLKTPKGEFCTLLQYMHLKKVLLILCCPVQGKIEQMPYRVDKPSVCPAADLETGWELVCMLYFSIHLQWERHQGPTNSLTGQWAMETNGEMYSQINISWK